MEFEIALAECIAIMWYEIERVVCNAKNEVISSQMATAQWDDECAYVICFIINKQAMAQPVTILMLIANHSFRWLINKMSEQIIIAYHAG